MAGMTEGPLDPVLAALARRIAAADQVSGPPRDQPLDAVARAVIVALGASAASIATHDPVTDRLVFVAAAGPAAGEVVGISIDAGAGIAGYAFTSGQPLAVADAMRDPRFDRTVAEATGYTPRSLLATPLLDDEGTVGVLEALDGRAGGFSLGDLDVAGALAAVATSIVRSGRIERDGLRLVRSVLGDVLGRRSSGSSGGDADSEALVDRATAELQTDPADPTWRLADRVARLHAVDPTLSELAVDWLDALLARPRPRR